MSQYDKIPIIDNFKKHFPYLADSVTDYQIINEFDLVVLLHDDSYILYDDFDKTIRALRGISSEDDYRREFGIRLRSIMDRKGITQIMLSESTGIHQARLSHYINGKHIPTLYTADMIAAALGCSVEELQPLL